MLLLSATSIVLSPSIPMISFFKVVLPHSEPTITVYVDILASALNTILKVANNDVTIIQYLNASSVKYVVFVYFSKISTIFFTLGIPQRVWLLI